MSLFDSTEQDDTDIQEWLQEIRTELKQAAVSKSDLYSFDFLQNAPIENELSRFQWEKEQREKCNHKLDSRCTPTLSEVSKTRMDSVLRLQSMTIDYSCVNFSTYN